MRAIISVSDKTGVTDFTKKLSQLSHFKISPSSIHWSPLIRNSSEIGGTIDEYWSRVTNLVFGSFNS